MKSFTQRLRAVAIILVTGLAITSSNPSVSFSNAPSGISNGEPVDAASRVKVNEAYGKLPLSFEANRGQTDAKAKFISRGSGYSLFLTPTEAVLSLTNPHGQPTAIGKGIGKVEQDKMGPKQAPADTKTNVVRIRMLGANPKPRVMGMDELPGKSNYFTGNDPKKWVKNVPQYAKVKYEAVYPGIDLVFYGNQRQLEYDLAVSPGADPKAIKLAFEGTDKLDVNRQGDLVLSLGTKGEHVLMRKPSVYQEVKGERRAIPAGYVIQDQHQVSIKVATYDKSESLIIDPVLAYSTYLGGSATDEVLGLAVDAAGNAYVTGATWSSDFPTSPGTYDGTFNGAIDVFVIKLNADGSALSYATYLGGSGSEYNNGRQGIAVDASGNAYVTGVTGSSNFPTTPGAYDTTFNGSVEAFVVKLNAAGSSLSYATFLGGTGWAMGTDIAVDGNGNAYVTGETGSPDFPTTPGAYDRTWNGLTDLFVVKLNATGTAPIYSTLLGGSGDEYNDYGNTIAIDGAGNSYLTGWTYSADFPTTPGAFDRIYNGGDAFVAKLDPTGSALSFSTYLGGSGGEIGTGIAVDSVGNVYVAGATGSADFPVTAGAYDTSPNDIFVAKLNATGSALSYATYLGGSGYESSYGLTLDINGSAYLAGGTTSPDFPTTPGAYDTTFNGGSYSSDGFVVKFNAAGSALSYATFLGGADNFDGGYGIAVDTVGNIYVAGTTGSTDFPTTPGAYDTTFNGDRDGFVTKISLPSVSLVSIAVTPANPTIIVGQTQQFTATGTFSDGSTRVLTSGADSWTSRAPMPTARGQLAAGVINGIVYAIGGFFSDPSYITHATLEAYDPATDTWTSKAPMPTPRSSLGAGVVNGILYAVGGYNSYQLGTVEAYDPATDSWTTKASMPTPRTEVGIGVVGGILYAVGGAGGGGALAIVEAYDPVTDTWTSKASMPTPRMGPAIGVVNGILYAIGGDSGTGSLTTVEAYDPATDSWTTKAAMPTARCCMGSGAVDGIVYAAGGFVHGDGNYLTTFEAYDPVANTWTTKDPVPANMFGNAVGVVNNVLYSVGGFSRGGPPTYDVITLNAVYAYAPPGEVTWSSSDTDVATIDPIGLATGLSPGTTMITATSGSISGSTTLTVNPQTFTLTLSTAGTGSGTVSGAGTYNSGQTATVSASANAGSTFTGWTGPNAAECATGSVLMNANKSCTANFTLNTHTLTLSTAGTGSGTTSGAGTFDYGQTATVSATANPGSTFTSWTGPNAAECATGSVLMNADKSCTANFTLNTYTLTLATAGTGSGTTSGAGTYNYGQTATVSATADSGSTFDGWTGPNAGECATGSVLMNANKSCTANFSLTAPLPDLIISALSTATTAVAPGKTFPITNTVKNQGAASAGGFTIAFHLSSNAVYGDGDDIAFTATRSVTSLAVGASSSANTTLTVPSAIPLDNYYVCAKADSGGTVSEGNENNNSSCTGGTIQVTLPDLIMAAVAPNASAVNQGATLSVTDTVMNQGLVSTGVGFRVGFYLHPSVGADVAITTTRSVAALAAGASSTGTTSLTIPAATPPNTYYVCAKADSANVVSETNESNNTLCSAAQVTVPPPDLVMTAVSTTATAVGPGKTFSLSNAVKNQGGSKAGAFTIAFHLSTNTTYGDGDDIAMTATRSLTALAIGASSVGTTTLTVPATTPLGTYYVCAMADSGNTVAEGDENNNSRCTAAPIQITRADLVMSAVTPNAATVNRGSTLSVGNTVQNQGLVSSTSFRIGFRLSVNNVYGDADDVVITTIRSVTSLATGAISSATSSLTISSTTPVGSYYICAMADSLNAVIETDEGNNTLCSGGTVTVQ